MAFSPSWLKLFSYQSTWYGGYKSKVYHQEFFFAADGKINPLHELEAYLVEIDKNDQTKKFGFVKDRAACAFPARYYLAHKMWPSRYPLVDCPQYDTWRENFSLGDAYLVYSSAYPNNPASLFGHTLIRFDRKRKGLDQDGKELLGYAVGFMAVTDPRDNPALYTYKGITGQYLGSFQIRPHYVNVGIYNNGEARDLWEYRLNFNEEELEYLQRLIYELSLGPGYPYYFFDDNCSYYLLQLLEMVRPAILLETKDRLVVLPHETLRDVVENYHSSLSKYRPSLSKIVDYRLKELSSSQISLYSSGMDSTKEMIFDDPKVVDTLVDGWKEKNYRNKTKLSSADSSRMRHVLLKRSEIDYPKFNDDRLTKLNQNQAPHLAHASHRLRMMTSDHKQKFAIGHGLHSRTDSIKGFDRLSFINYLELELAHQKSDGISWERFKLIEIDALQSFSFYRPKISWRINSELINDHSSLSPLIEGGVGVTESFSFHLLSLFLNIQDHYDSNQTINYIKSYLSLQLTWRNEKYLFDGKLQMEKYLTGEIKDLNYDFQMIYKYFITNDFSISYQYNWSMNLSPKTEHLVGGELRF